MIAAYRQPDPAAGRELMVKLIESLGAEVRVWQFWVRMRSARTLWRSCSRSVQ
jgi:hypothetical protein